MMRLRPARAGVIATAMAIAVLACGSDDGDAALPILVLSAFPAEMAPLLESATVSEIVVVDERPWRVGEINGTPVVIGLTGIGLVNAERATRSALDSFAVRGVVFSGVAGSLRRIGDIVAPEEWYLPEDGPFNVDQTFLRVAREVANDDVAYDRCTILPAEPQSEPVCLEHAPALFVGGRGESDDPFGGTALPCVPGGDDVFGCDVAAAPIAANNNAGGTTKGATTEPDAVDMESAASAREAAARGLPFIAFRAVSDGTGDPLMLPGFPAQFFAYYRLAGRNAAIATIAFLDRM